VASANRGPKAKNALSSRDINSFSVKQVNTAVTGKALQKWTASSPLIVRNTLAHQGQIKHVGGGGKATEEEMWVWGICPQKIQSICCATSKFLYNSMHILLDVMKKQKVWID